MANRRFQRQQLKITKAALWLLVLEASVSVVFLILDNAGKQEMGTWLAANGNQVWSQGKVWTLITSPFLQPEPINLFFNGFMLWMFVPTLERWWGPKRLLKFALYTSLAGTIAGTIVGALLQDGTPVSGLDPFMFASILAFGVLYSDQPVQFFGVIPMTGRQMMIGISVLAGLFLVIGQAWVIGASYVAAMLVAWLLTNGKWTPKIWWLRRKQKKIRNRLKVVPGGAKSKDDKKWLN